MNQFKTSVILGGRGEFDFCFDMHSKLRNYNDKKNKGKKSFDSSGVSYIYSLMCCSSTSVKFVKFDRIFYKYF